MRRKIMAFVLLLTLAFPVHAADIYLEDSISDNTQEIVTDTVIAEDSQEMDDEIIIAENEADTEMLEVEDEPEIDEYESEANVDELEVEDETEETFDDGVITAASVSDTSSENPIVIEEGHLNLNVRYNASVVFDPNVISKVSGNIEYIWEHNGNIISKTKKMILRDVRESGDYKFTVSSPGTSHVSSVTYHVNCYLPDSDGINWHKIKTCPRVNTKLEVTPDMFICSGDSSVTVNEMNAKFDFNWSCDNTCKTNVLMNRFKSTKIVICKITPKKGIKIDGAMEIKFYIESGDCDYIVTEDIKPTVFEYGSHCIKCKYCGFSSCISYPPVDKFLTLSPKTFTAKKSAAYNKRKYTINVKFGYGDSVVAVKVTNPKVAKATYYPAKNGESGWIKGCVLQTAPIKKGTSEVKTTVAVKLKSGIVKKYTVIAKK